MPQLDSFSYFSQVFWLVFFFLTFYLVVMQTILPTLYRTMRLRQRKLELMQSNKGTLKEEESSILAAFDQSLGQSMAQSRKSIGRTIDQTNQWIADSAKNLNQSSIHDANQLYLQDRKSVV